MDKRLVIKVVAFVVLVFTGSLSALSSETHAQKLVDAVLDSRDRQAAESALASIDPSIPSAEFALGPIWEAILLDPSEDSNWWALQKLDQWGDGSWWAEIGDATFQAFFRGGMSACLERYRSGDPWALALVERGLRFPSEMVQIELDCTEQGVESVGNLNASIGLFAADIAVQLELSPDDLALKQFAATVEELVREWESTRVYYGSECGVPVINSLQPSN